MIYRSEIIQDSELWHAFRADGVGASEISALTGSDIYKNTPYSTWLVKTKRVKGFAGNSFTTKGKELEAKARARYELINMDDMPPACAIHPRFEICRASLDGISADGKKLLEIKCPTGRSTIDAALKGSVPMHYWEQCQYQMAVTGAETNDFFVYHEESGQDALVSVEADPSCQGRLIAAALDFWSINVLSDIPPLLTEDDVLLIENNDELLKLSEIIIKEKDMASKVALELMKHNFLLLAGHNKAKCGRVQVSAVNRNGKFSFYKLTISEGAK